MDISVDRGPFMVRWVSTFRRCVNTNMSSFGGAYRLTNKQKQTNKYTQKTQQTNKTTRIQKTSEIDPHDLFIVVVLLLYIALVRRKRNNYMYMAYHRVQY